MGRIRLKKIRKFNKLNFLLVILIIIFISIFWVLRYFNNKISPILLNYAEIETIKLANLIINRAITKQIAKEINIEELFTTIQNDIGEIQTIDFNPIIVNRVLSTTTNIVHHHLKAIEQGNIELLELSDDILVKYNKENLKSGIIYEIPFWAFTGNAFLSNLGPRIPVRLNLVGNVVSNINTIIKPYGINNALVEVYVKIEVTEQVNLPFMSKRITIQNDIPVALKVIQGKVPDYYHGSGLDKNSSIFTLPIQ